MRALEHLDAWWENKSGKGAGIVRCALVDKKGKVKVGQKESRASKEGSIKCGDEVRREEASRPGLRGRRYGGTSINA